MRVPIFLLILLQVLFSVGFDLLEDEEDADHGTLSRVKRQCEYNIDQITETKNGVILI